MKSTTANRNYAIGNDDGGQTRTARKEVFINRLEITWDVYER